MWRTAAAVEEAGQSTVLTALPPRAYDAWCVRAEPPDERRDELASLRANFDDAIAFGVSMRTETLALRRELARLRAAPKAEEKSVDDFEKAFGAASNDPASLSLMQLFAVAVVAFTAGTFSHDYF